MSDTPFETTENRIVVDDTLEALEIAERLRAEREEKQREIDKALADIVENDEPEPTPEQSPLEQPPPEPVQPAQVTCPSPSPSPAQEPQGAENSEPGAEPVGPLFEIEPPKPPEPQKPFNRVKKALNENEFVRKEIVVDSNGVPRQAGADSQEGEFVKRFKLSAEQSLFLFCKGVLGRHFLTPALHKPVCEFIQKVPPFRKLALLPREHAKTAIVSGGLPLHIIIQPAETNIYFPGLEGSECRLLLCGETETMAKKNLRVLEGEHTGNKLFRALWPHRVWDNPRSQSKEWSSTALIFPRKTEWPDQTIRAVGVGGAITGARPNVLIKDDLVSFKAANSEVVMEEAIEWHKTSRALLDTYEVESGLRSLEFIIGTRWAIYDLYSYIIDNDPSVEVIDSKFHSIVRDGKILWPEKHTFESIEELRSEYGSTFYLLYMNNAADPELVDFDLDLVREFQIIEGKYALFEENERDEKLAEKYGKKGDPDDQPALKVERGTRLTPGLLRDLAGRKQWFRARYG